MIEVFPYTEAAVVSPDQVDEESSSPSRRRSSWSGCPPGDARAFVQRAVQVVEAGRPSCPFCGGPVSPDGHLCVRANGFRRRDP